MKAASWFDRLYAEYGERHACMFAFSNKQVSERFVEWGEPEPTFPLVGWSSVGGGLLVRTDVRDEFLGRMASDHEADLATLPTITVEFVGHDSWDRARYRVIAADPGSPVTVGQRLADVSLGAPGTAVELHSITAEGEPIGAVPVRVIHAVLAAG